MEVVYLAIESAYSSSVSLRLNAGFTGSGSMKVVNVALRGLLHGADKDKIMSVVGTLLPVLIHPLYQVRRTEITVIEN